MARIIFDKGTMSGKLGDSVYLRTGIVRQYKVPKNPATPQQEAVRAALAYLSDFWFSGLTAVQRSGWDTYAAGCPMSSKLGQTFYLTGQQMFVRSNAVSKVHLSSVFGDAPVDQNLGTITPPTADTFAAGPPSTVSINFNEGDTWHSAVAPLGHLFIFASRPKDPTVNFFKGPYRYCTNIPGTQATPLAAVTLPFNAAAGQRIFFRAQAQTNDGRLSQSVSFQLDA